MTKRISVYLPTRNRAALVAEAARSVLQQTYADFELIIFDDASEDDTYAVIERIARDDARVRIVSTRTRVGPSEARNAAIARAAGELVTGVDDDDYMLPNRLSSLSNQMTNETSLVCSSFFIQRDGKSRLRNSRSCAITLKRLLHYNIVGNQALLRRDDVMSVGGFDQNLPTSEDYDLWTRIVERHGPGIRLSQPTYVKRELPGSEQLTHSNAFEVGARLYTDKHRCKMSPSQLRSQALIHLISSRSTIDLKSLPRVTAAYTLPLLFRYAISRLIRN